jgi:hypothetical protein
MSVLQNWLEANPNGVKFKCSCGATVYFKVFDAKKLVQFHARCWKCDKELDYYEHSLLIESACFDIIGHTIDFLVKEFNKGVAGKAIRVVKK